MADDNEGSATQRLSNTLLVTFAAVFIGFMSKRLGGLDPDQGDMKGFGFFIGTLAFPLLIWKTVATAKLGDADIGILAACTLGKALVMILTWGVTFFGYKRKRKTGQRIQTATVFSFFAIASNDFAIGFPVIDALYGPEENMGLYIAGNALVGSLVFVPIVMILFSVGGALQKQEVEEEQAPKAGGASKCFLITLDVIRSPVIAMTLLGLLYKLFFSITLRRFGEAQKLPSPLSDLVDLVTSPFAMGALFLTGTSLRDSKVSRWPVFLVIMKGVVCAYGTYAFAGYLVQLKDAHDIEVKVNFSFFYGMIPTSSAPLVFATRYDPESAGQIATAVLLGLVLAGPMMLQTALFLEVAHTEMNSVLGVLQYQINGLSLVCGAMFLTVLAVLHKEWCTSAVKILIAVYGISVCVYASLGFAMNPRISAQCSAFNESGHTWLSYLIGWMQNFSQSLVILLQFVCLPKQMWEFEMTSRSVGLTVLACLILSLVPPLLTVPSTLNEICAAVEPLPQSGSVLPNLIWTFVLLVTMLSLVIRKSFFGRMASRSDSEFEDSLDGDGGPMSRTESRHSKVSFSSESGEDDIREPSAWFAEDDSWSTWSLVNALVGLQLLRFFTQCVNTSLVLFHTGVMGSFAQMLVIENVLMHSQPIVLVIMLFSSHGFSNQFKAALPFVPWRSNSLADDDVPVDSPLQRVLTKVHF